MWNNENGTIFPRHGQEIDFRNGPSALSKTAARQRQSLGMSGFPVPSCWIRVTKMRRRCCCCCCCCVVVTCVRNRIWNSIVGIIKRQWTQICCERCVSHDWCRLYIAPVTDYLVVETRSIRVCNCGWKLYHWRCTENRLNRLKWFETSFNRQIEIGHDVHSSNVEQLPLVRRSAIFLIISSICNAKYILPFQNKLQSD